MPSTSQGPKKGRMSSSKGPRTKLGYDSNNTCFHSVMSRNLTDYVIIPFLPSGTLRNFTDFALTLPFNFRHVTELHGLCYIAFLLASDMCQNFPNCLTMGAKYLEVVKRGSHPNKDGPRTKLGYDTLPFTLHPNQLHSPKFGVNFT